MRQDQREPFCAADNFKRFSVHLFNSVCQRLLRCVMFGSLASFSLLNLHLILVIFDVLAQVAFVRFLVSQSPLCSSNFFSSRNVIQQVINIAIMLFKAQHGLSASRFFAFDGQLGYPLDFLNTVLTTNLPADIFDDIRSRSCGLSFNFG